MRALVIRGFCIAPETHAKDGEIVDIPEGLYREMLARGSIAPAPPVPVVVVPEPDPVPEPVKPKSK